MMAKTIIHVNRHKIAANKKLGCKDPVLTVKHKKTNRYAHEVIIRDKGGEEMARVVYRPDNPLSCGAVLWIESYETVELITHDRAEEA